MSDPHKNWKEFLINEAGLARIRQDMLDYDTAFITAFRDDVDDKTECVFIPPPKEEIDEGKKENYMQYRYRQNYKKNRRNNRDLSAYLLSRGYGIKGLQGSYIENFNDPPKIPKEVKEASFFVTNLNNDPEFFDEIIDLGKRYCQDSVILVPKGEEGYIYGTNKGRYPGLDQKETLGEFVGGQTAQFMSRIGGRPFHMKEEQGDLKRYSDYSPKQKQAIKLTGNRVSRELNEMHMLGEAAMSTYDKNGMVKLYHFAPSKEEEITVDPSRFGKECYSRREKERSSYPRSFFYVDLNQSEDCVRQGKTLYTLDIPIHKLYSIAEDPDDIVKNVRHPVYNFRNDIEWTELFKQIHQNYDGAYYSTPKMDIVVLFEPYTANKVETK